MKHTITIDSPQQLKRKIKEIETALTTCKTYELHLICTFIAPDNVMEQLYKEFHIIKNKIAFKLRPCC